MDTAIVLGTITGGAFVEAPPIIINDAPELTPHLDKPYLTGNIERRLGLSLRKPTSKNARAGQACSTSADLLKRSATVIGAPGGGKTLLTAYLTRRLLECGYSVIWLDIQTRSIALGIAQARAAGLTRDQITVLWPREPERGVSGFNPFAVSWDEAVGAVDTFVDLIRESKQSWGVALDDLLRCMGVVVASQKPPLSPLELLRAIQRSDLRKRLLENSRANGAWERFPEQHEFVAREFRDRGETAPAAANKLRGLLTNPFLRRLMIARRDTLDIPGHWQRQRFTAVHLDASLSDDGTHLLSGLIADSLYRAAMTTSGPVPVVLVVEELGLQARHSADAIRRILAGTRQCGLSVLAVTQHLDQVPDQLRTALMSSALRVFFRLEAHDAAVVAGSLDTGSRTRPERIALSTVKDQTERAYFWITDAKGSRLRLSPTAWHGVESAGSSGRQIQAIKAVAALAGTGRLYVVTKRGVFTELTRFVTALPEQDYGLLGPDGLILVIRFPRPNLKVLTTKTAAQRREEAEALLQALPVQHAVVRLDTGESYMIKVVDVSVGPLPDPLDFLGNGQSREEIAEVEAWRRAQIEGAARSGVCAAGEEVDDNGNL